MPPRSYRISVRGLDASQLAELEGWIVERAPHGVVRLAADDVATLHGILERLREMDIELLSVDQPDSEPPQR